MEKKTTIGQRLKRIRGKLSQAEAAARIGMKQQSWRVYETDASQPGAGLIRRICAAFGVTSDWLLGIGDIEMQIHISADDGGGGRGKETICKRCPYKKRLEKIARLAFIDSAVGQSPCVCDSVAKSRGKGVE